MVNLSILEKRGITAEKLKEIFTAEENTVPSSYIYSTIGEPPPGSPQETITDYDKQKRKAKKLGESKVNELRNRIRLRIANGRDQNISTSRIYYALDCAWDVPFRQVTPTLIQQLSDKTWENSDALKKSLTAFGMNLDDVVVDDISQDTKVPGKSVKKISVPAFFQILVPLCRAYVTIRRAKIMNDRRMVPFLKYEPGINSSENRMKAEALTSRVEVSNRQMDYFAAVDQSVFQMLHYSKAAQFPVEEWYSEEQEVVESDGDKKGTTKTKVIKEGLRYHHPPPYRWFYDESFPAKTFNTDTGCTYAGYWRVVRYGDIMNRKGFYNTDKISLGNYLWVTNARTFFDTVYPCTIQFPAVLENPQNDRETKMINQIYTTDMTDKAVVVTEYWERLVPSEWGLGDYDYPVWFRFVVASDDTIIYAAPVPYTPVVYYGYDEDVNRSQNASLTLETLPFQDHFSNLLTQYILAVKQNLANVTFVDTDVVTKQWMDRIENLHERLYRKRNFIPFSSKYALRGKENQAQAFISHVFPQLNTAEIMNAMKLLLDILERVLQMSAQELGAAATHEQTAGEIKVISANTSTRLQYTSIPVDSAREAMKRQIYYGLMNYGEEDGWAEIPIDPQLSAEDLEKMGFTWEQKKNPVKPGDRKMVVKANRQAITLESFTSSRDWEDRSDNVEGAKALAMFFQQILMGPLGPAIGADQGIEIVNLIGRLAGFPREFKLSNMTPPQTPEQQAENVRQQLSGFVAEIQNQILGQVKEGLTPVIEKVNAMEKSQSDIAQTVQLVVQKLKEIQDIAMQSAQQIAPPDLQPPMMVPPAPPPPAVMVPPEAVQQI